MRCGELLRRPRILRVSDALIRMASRITNLFSYEGLMYLCEKLRTVPVEAFGPSMREFSSQYCGSSWSSIPTIVHT